MYRKHLSRIRQFFCFVNYNFCHELWPDPFDHLIRQPLLGNTLQRPFGRRVRSIGAWQTAMQLMGILGVFVNCALISNSGLVQRLWPDLSLNGQLLLIVVLEHSIFIMRMLIDYLIPDVPVIQTLRTPFFLRV